MIIVQGAFAISPIHDRPLQIGERMEEKEEEEEEEEEEGGCFWQVHLQASSFMVVYTTLSFGV